MGEYLTTEQQLEARRRVALGAALLDEKRPGWRGRIDIAEMSIAEPCDCILGQTLFSDEERTAAFGDDIDLFDEGLRRLGLSYRSLDSDDAEYGFNAGVGSVRVFVSYAALQAAWEELLAPVAS